MTNLPSKEDFIEYERLRSEGVHNMFAYCALDPDLRAVMKHYDELNTKYPDVRVEQ